MKFRVIKPHETQWVEVQNQNFATAIQQWHYDHMGEHDVAVRIGDDGHREDQHFALFLSDDGEQLISRICHAGIYRKGGVRPRDWHKDPLVIVAEKLGVDRNALDGPWEGEEQYP